MDYLGIHLFVDLYGCDIDRTTDEKYVEKILKEAASLTDAKIIVSFFHKFDDGAVAGIVILAEGDYKIRSWANGYVGLDLYSNAETTDNEKALSFLVRKFGATKYSASEIKRGNTAEV